MVRNSMLVESKNSFNVMISYVIPNILPHSLFTPLLLQPINQLLIIGTRMLINSQIFASVGKLLLSWSPLSR